MTVDRIDIALSGYGSMGRELEFHAAGGGLDVKRIYDIYESDKVSILKDEKEFPFSVAIEFTLPDTVLGNIKIFAEHGKNIVVGTTGWHDRTDEVRRIVEANNVGLIYGSNFSMGMQMFMRIVRRAGQLVDKLDGFDVMLHEMHHHRKKDSPSGSAVTLANILLEELSRKKSMQSETAHDAIESDKLHVSSTRGGEITGLHTVYIDSLADTLELTHRAKNRSGFALGALSAARWINGRKGMFEVGDMLKEIWGE